MLGQTNFIQALTPELRAQAKLAIKDEYTFDFLELGDKNPSIGIILCKEKNRTIVEYVLHDARKPMGMATNEIKRTLLRELKGELPQPEEIAALLEGIEQ